MPKKLICYLVASHLASNSVFQSTVDNSIRRIYQSIKHFFLSLSVGQLLAFEKVSHYISENTPVTPVNMLPFPPSFCYFFISLLNDSFLFPFLFFMSSFILSFPPLVLRDSLARIAWQAKPTSELGATPQSFFHFSFLLTFFLSSTFITCDLPPPPPLFFFLYVLYLCFVGGL